MTLSQRSFSTHFFALVESSMHPLFLSITSKVEHLAVLSVEALSQYGSSLQISVVSTSSSAKVTPELVQ